MFSAKEKTGSVTVLFSLTVIYIIHSYCFHIMHSLRLFQISIKKLRCFCWDDPYCFVT